MTTHALTVANRFVQLAKRDNTPLDPMKLQKLIYYANGWHLVAFGRPLIAEEIEAWRYGPVVSSVYHAFKKYGSGEITAKAPPMSLLKEGRFQIHNFDSIDERESDELVEKVWKTYGEYSGVQLSNLTHKAGTAWARVRDDRGGLLTDSVPIPEQYIREEFQAKLHRE